MLVQHVIGELGLGKGLSKCHTNREWVIMFSPKELYINRFHRLQKYLASVLNSYLIIFKLLQSALNTLQSHLLVVSEILGVRGGGKSPPLLGIASFCLWHPWHISIIPAGSYHELPSKETRGCAEWQQGEQKLSHSPERQQICRSGGISGTPGFSLAHMPWLRGTDIIRN